MSERGQKWINEQKEFYKKVGISEEIGDIKLRYSADIKMLEGSIDFDEDDLKKMKYPDDEINRILARYDVEALMDMGVKLSRINKIRKWREQYNFLREICAFSRDVI